MKPAIIETQMSVLVTEGRELNAELVRSEKDFAWRRLVMGRFLAKARSALPKRGSATYGWMTFLEAIEMNEVTASRYITLAEATPLTFTEKDSDQIQTYAELGLDRREGPKPPADIPAPTDEDRPAPDELADEPPAPDVDIDRNTWCTPKWIADAIGDFDLDPCSNERSHIQAAREFRLERGEDGLLFASKMNTNDRVFINPPYARGQVIQWIEAYAHTRFCFLLKFDTSTGWFEELMKHTKLVLFPRRTRIEFEPPPGVPAEKAGGVQFPHALFYARAEDATVAIQEACFSPWRIK